MKIYTITLNPAYDIHACTDHFAPFHENLARVTSRQAGGKGVNLSRALQSGGTENTALIVLGKDNCAEFKEELALAGLRTVFLEKPGRIRNRRKPVKGKDSAVEIITPSAFRHGDGRQM